jgi:hypothetical protein
MRGETHTSSSCGTRANLCRRTGHLEQRLAEPLCDAAVYLSARQHWVDEWPAVVDREEPINGDIAGCGVDLDNGDIGAERKSEFLGVVENPRSSSPGSRPGGMSGTK